MADQTLNHFRDLETRIAWCEMGERPLTFVIGDMTQGKLFCLDCAWIMEEKFRTDYPELEKRRRRKE